MKKVFAISALLLALAVPALAADHIIANGVDLWRTPGDGTSYADFSADPIPAGFFCPGSAPFTGRIVMKGIPIASSQPGLQADTIIQRLDNARFNKRGVATTRIQMRAMQFEGLTLVKTVCGAFKAYVRLDGEQPVTTMRIVRDHEKGGRILAPISVNIKISFEPVGRETTEVWEAPSGTALPTGSSHGVDGRSRRLRCRRRQWLHEGGYRQRRRAGHLPARHVELRSRPAGFPEGPARTGTCSCLSLWGRAALHPALLSRTAGNGPPLPAPSLRLAEARLLYL